MNNAQPAPALPGDDCEICARLLSACTGHPHALIPWPHRLLHDAVSHISDLTRRLAEAEQDERNARRHALDLEKIERKLMARVRELEKDLGAAVEQKVHAIFNLGRCKALLNTANLKLERLRNV